jgi:hypothetical protein
VHPASSRAILRFSTDFRVWRDVAAGDHTPVTVERAGPCREDERPAGHGGGIVIWHGRGHTIAADELSRHFVIPIVGGFPAQTECPFVGGTGPSRRLPLHASEGSEQQRLEAAAADPVCVGAREMTVPSV